MEKYQLIGGLSHYLYIGFQPSQVMQDFCHPLYVLQAEPHQTPMFAAQLHHKLQDIRSRVLRPVDQIGWGSR